MCFLLMIYILSFFFVFLLRFFFAKQKTAYEMRISDWSSDVCSSDLVDERVDRRDRLDPQLAGDHRIAVDVDLHQAHGAVRLLHDLFEHRAELLARSAPCRPEVDDDGRRA